MNEELKHPHSIDFSWFYLLVSFACFGIAPLLMLWVVPTQDGIPLLTSLPFVVWMILLATSPVVAGAALCSWLRTWFNKSRPDDLIPLAFAKLHFSILILISLVMHKLLGPYWSLGSIVVAVTIALMMLVDAFSLAALMAWRDRDPVPFLTIPLVAGSTIGFLAAMTIWSSLMLPRAIIESAEETAGDYAYCIEIGGPIDDWWDMGLNRVMRGPDHHALLRIVDSYGEFSTWNWSFRSGEFERHGSRQSGACVPQQHLMRDWTPW